MSRLKFGTPEYTIGLVGDLIGSSEFHGIEYNFGDASSLGPDILSPVGRSSKLITGVTYGTEQRGIVGHSLETPDWVENRGDLPDVNLFLLRAGMKITIQHGKFEKVRLVQAAPTEEESLLIAECGEAEAPFAALMAAKMIINHGGDKSLALGRHGILYSPKGIRPIVALARLQLLTIEHFASHN